MLREALDDATAAFREALDGVAVTPRLREVGTVIRVGAGVVRVRGLPGLMSEELVELAGGGIGMALNLERNEADLSLLRVPSGLAAGGDARATGRLADIPVGDGLLGRIVDTTGRPLDGLGPIRASRRRPVEAEAPAIRERAPVTVPLESGLKVVDALVPVGRGQRELVIGDRQTGKTTLAVDTIINQRGKGVRCVYCAVAQRGAAVMRVVETLRSSGALAWTAVVVAGGEEPVGLQVLAPFAATSIAEHFMRRGQDALVVYDDLTRHARAYRELSLLLRRPPGREAYPGDVFYLHARLLERATHLREELGGGSLTALPIVETQAQDIAAYIPTNLISITDGQIYMSPGLFRRGLLPPVDVGRSVSRVGGKTQLPAHRAVAGPLRLAYSQFEELETFARFATRMDEDTRAVIERGRRVREALRQDEHDPLPPAEQVAVLDAVRAGLLDDVPVERIGAVEQVLRAELRKREPGICERIDSGGVLGEEDWQRLRAVAIAARDLEAARVGAT